MKGFNLSLTSLCLRCIHKLVSHIWLCAIKQRRNEDKYEKNGTTLRRKGKESICNG